MRLHDGHKLLFLLYVYLFKSIQLHLTEDPVHIFDHEPEPAHSVLKLVIDLFSRKKTAEHFYTNDVKVAIDIIVRQLADLSPGDVVSSFFCFPLFLSYGKH